MAIMNNRGHGFFDLENRDLRLSSVTLVVAFFFHGVLVLL
jgi:hypothetical protein